MRGLVTISAAVAAMAAGHGRRPADGEYNSSDAYLAALPPGYQDKQIALMDFNTALGELPGVYEAGYVKSHDDVPSNTVTIYWHEGAPVPPAVTALVKSAPVNVEFATWPFSYQQITEASERLQKAACSGVIPGFIGNGVGGFDTKYPGLTLKGRYTSERGAQNPAAVERAATAIAGLPVRVIPVEAVAAQETLG
jgi:hypothetical protein